MAEPGLSGAAVPGNQDGSVHGVLENRAPLSLNVARPSLVRRTPDYGKVFKHSRRDFFPSLVDKSQKTKGNW